MKRMTKQKRLLYEEIKRLSSFFDAYDFYNQISKTYPKVGIATIYRFLNNLENDGEIHAFFCNNKKIYSSNKTSHAHFKCEKCEKLEHINIKKVDFLKETYNGEVCHFQIELTGICSECIIKNSSKDSHQDLEHS
ncbi:MAG TPA: transcriptional repressor [Candidatus Nanoarchaeia archaeon]|nr:transcriptional repressor [Candidatus Nanoarchaeia archaeon]